MIKRMNTKTDNDKGVKRPSRGAPSDKKRRRPIWAELADDEGESFNLDDPPTDYDDPDVCYRIAMNNPHS